MKDMANYVLGGLMSFLIVFAIPGVYAGRVPTVYDVLQLVYQVCSTEEYHRQENLMCVNYHMGTEVTSAVKMCMSDKNESSASSVKEFCEQLTQVQQWTAKHRNPPAQLTRVMGLAALGRMACVLSEVQRPLPMWQAAFTKCFPEYRPDSSKENTRNRNENVIRPNE